MTRRFLWWSSGVLLALCAVAWLVWWGLRPPPAAAVHATMATLVRTLQFSARVATASRVDVGSTLTGRVREVLVGEGAPVEPGDVLVRLDGDEWRSALAQAEAGERQAQARLSGLRSTGRLAVQASVAQAESVLLAARADLQRTQGLVGQGFLSQSRLDEARRAVGVAQAQLDAARAQRDANADTGTEVAQAQAQLAVAAAARQAAQARWKEAAITAPAKGRVLARAVEPGQIVQPGRALLTLALSGPLQLVAQVDERYLEQLAPGQQARVLADAYPTQVFRAQVLSIAPVVDAQRGAIEVKFALQATAFPIDDGFANLFSGPLHKAIADRHGISMKAAGLQFALANPAVAAVIPGASKPDRIAEDRAALNEVVPADFWRELRRAGLVHRDAPLPE